jgi:gliding motility-associated-like protein
MRLAYTIILLFICSLSFSQSPSDWWYFGENAGVHFTSTGPVADTNGVLYTFEGCASVSDAQGNLQFYTDGTWVFNAQHDTMPDGDSLFGNGSSTQSAVIVPYPGNSDKYYIFTVRGCTGGSTTGLLGYYFSYSIVDMTLESGLGNVEVAQKNIVLFDSSAEKCTAMLHANGSDIWVIGHEQPTDKFHAYHLTNTGIVDTVTSEVGPVTSNCVGYMLASHQGDKIGMTMTSSDSVYVFPFDQATGQVSVPLALDIVGLAYGIHFSPNDELLYCSYSRLTQFDLTAANVQASRFTVDSTGTNAAIAEGPDEKLYFARSGKQFLSSIEDPNVYGAGCNYIDTSVTLAGRLCFLGLPNNVAPGLFLIAAIQFERACLGDTTLFSLDTSNVDAAQWNFGDPGSGGSNTSTAFFPLHVFSDTGEFLVRLIVVSDTVSDTAFQTIRIYPRQMVDLGPDVTVCRGAQILFDVSQPYAEFLWHDASVADTFLTNGETQVQVSVFGRCDTVMDSVLILYDDTLSFELGPDTLLCGGDSFRLSTGNTNSAVVQWSTGDSIETIYAKVSGTYEVNVINACGSLNDTIQVLFKPVPSSILLPADTINCFDNEIILEHADLDSVTYIWSDSSSKKNYRVDTTEMVWLAAFNECGTTIDTINIIFNGEIISELGDDTTICDLDTIVLDAFSPGADYLWSTGDTIDTILTAQVSQLYVVTVTQGLCQTIESKRVDVANVLCPGIDCALKVGNVITPNGDGVNDVWRVTSDCDIVSFGLNIYNRWGQLVHSSDNAKFGWDGTVFGAPASEGVYYYELVFKDTVIVNVDNLDFRGSITLLR